MRCKTHSDDLSSIVGVCASCLRERLCAITVAHGQSQAQQEYRKSDNRQPTPLSLPRSVSPYISRRKTDANAATLQLHASRHQLFQSTPLVEPTGSAQMEMKKTKQRGRRAKFYSLFSGLFRSKPNNPCPDSGPRIPAESSSWFSSIVPGGRKNKIRTSSLDEGAIRSRRRTCRDRDHGMSPVTYSDEEYDEHCRGESSGYSSESSQGWRQTPRRTPAKRREGGRGACHSRNVSGMAFCLSPLVRPSPNRHRNQKGVPPEMVMAGESRIPPKTHVWAATSFCKSRSRKLADFGRCNYNATTH